MNTMKNINRLKLTFTALAFALALVISGCGHDAPQADNMSSNSMTNNGMDNMGHMDSNSMHMAGSSMNNMSSNHMNMTNSPQMGKMMSDSMKATNQAK
jgi:hypothetical protein